MFVPITNLPEATSPAVRVVKADNVPKLKAMSQNDKKPGLKVRLAQFAKEKYPNWINGGELEMFAAQFGYKPSNGSRRARELAEFKDGIEPLFEKRENVKGCVGYRYLQKATQKNPTNFHCFKCSKDAVTYIEDKPVCLDHSKKKVAPRLF